MLNIVLYYKIWYNKPILYCTIEKYYKSCYIVLALYCCSKDYVDLTEWLLYYSDFSAQGVADGGGGGG